MSGKLPIIGAQFFVAAQRPDPNKKNHIETAEDYGLTTLNVIYHLPDHPKLLQDFLWQQYDMFPTFPTVQKFLHYWQNNIDGPIHAVTLAHARLITPRELTLKDILRPN